MSAKHEWGPGPWDNEPDELVFVSGKFQCSIKRNMGIGILCGYIEIFPKHPWFGNMPNDINIHGGITYNKLEEHKRVFGFDCNHADDFSPWVKIGDIKDYKTIYYVKNEINNLAKQANEALLIWVNEQLESGKVFEQSYMNWLYKY